MPVAYGYTEEEPGNTNPCHDNTQACRGSSEREGSLVEQTRSSMSKDDGDENIWSSGLPGQVRNSAGYVSESRAELIARIKRERDQRPAWLQSVADDTLEGLSRAPMPPLPLTTSLLPPIELGEGTNMIRRLGEQRFEHGSTIERPRSALHAGDFRQRKPNEPESGSPRPNNVPQKALWMSTSPTTPWYAPQLRERRSPPLSETRAVISDEPKTHPEQRDRASSYSTRRTSFIFRPPTSPLAVHSNSNDLDFEEFAQGRNQSPDKSYRRRTFSPSSLQRNSTYDEQSNSMFDEAQWPTSLRREGSFPYQAHQPRRSITMLGHPQSYTGSHTSPSRARRPSTSGDSSFMTHAPMVGRYEESILLGRMSTLPSKPLDFVAQIGVLGKGNCKSSLKCPPHVTVPFPAVFYDYKHPRDYRASASEGPSPYVGQVDLENNLKNVMPGSNKTLRRSQSPDSDIGSNGEDSNRPKRNAATSTAQLRRRQISKRAPRGSYRIPQQGQLQIVIKNPNKTAVKLFLVPYDLTGMESGQKTFIRQRSYSAGPIIDMPLSARSNLGTDRPEAALTSSDNPEDRPVLRYLVHLHICCPSRGRFYLYKSIRIVFANRVPDGKEKLRVETQLPEPRFSAYKPEVNSSGQWGNRQADKPQPQRHVSHPSPATAEDPFSHNMPTEPLNGLDPTLPVSKPAFAFPRLPPQRALSRIPSNGSSVPGDTMSVDNHDEQISPKSGAPSRLQSPISWTNAAGGRRGFYETIERTPSPAGRPAREGLLAMQLRDWAEQSRTQPPADT